MLSWSLQAGIVDLRLKSGVFTVQLTRHTDYSLRILLYLGAIDAPVTIADIATCYGISRNHLVKVAHRLGQLGFISTMRGRTGGLALAHDPKAITLGHVVRVMEPGFDIVECFDNATNQCVISDVCRLRSALTEANLAFLKVLDGYTLADLLADPAQIRKSLGLSKVNS